MFRDKKDKGPEPPRRGALDTVIGPGAEITGDVVVRAGARIDGRVKGNVSCQGELVIGKDGTVEGEVKAASAVLSGRITGKLLVEDRAELSSTARMEGDVACVKLVIEEGAFFQGQCQMSAKPTPRLSKHAQMSGILLASFGVLFLIGGYFTYGRLAGRIFGIASGNLIPAVSKREGVDYAPARNWLVLYGHHFSSIAGAAPVVGPRGRDGRPVHPGGKKGLEMPMRNNL